MGHTYMLTQNEELWQKELPPNVEALLASPFDPLADRSDRTTTGGHQVRDKTRVVSYRVPHNAAVQVYDYTEKRARWDPGFRSCWWWSGGLNEAADAVAAVLSSGWCSAPRW